MKKVFAILLPIIAIALIGFVVTKYVMPQPVNLVIKCQECSEITEDAKGFVEGPWPMVCPKCKQKAAIQIGIYHDPATKKVYYLTDEEYQKELAKKNLERGKP